MTDNEKHELILSVADQIKPWLLSLINENPEQSYSVFDAREEALQRFSLPVEVVDFDLQSGRGLLRIRIEWDLWELCQEKAIKKVDPDTYQSLAGTMPEYTGGEASAHRNSVKRRWPKSLMTDSTKRLQSLGMSREEIVAALLKSPTFSDAPRILLFQAVNDVFRGKK